MKVMEEKLRLLWLDPKAQEDLEVPRYHSDLAAGMDVRAAVSEPLILKPGAIVKVPCGFALAIAPGHEVQVRPRSGLAVKFGVTVVNAPGTIDADYRGEVMVALINLGQAPFTINRGDRVAQLVLAPVLRARIVEVASLEDTGRGTGGFGHSGI